MIQGATYAKDSYSSFHLCIINQCDSFHPGACTKTERPLECAAQPHVTDERRPDAVCGYWRHRLGNSATARGRRDDDQVSRAVSVRVCVDDGRQHVRWRSARISRRSLPSLTARCSTTK